MIVPHKIVPHRKSMKRISEVIPGATYFAKEDYIEVICKTESDKIHA